VQFQFSSHRWLIPFPFSRRFHRIISSRLRKRVKIVGDRLSLIATASGNSREADLFGRSAFNRYYYASFLIVRETLKRIDNRWAEPSHAEIPDLLRGQVLKHIKKEVRSLEENDLIAHGEAQSTINRAINATNALADLLSKAREVRRVADYEPDTMVTRVGSVMSLAEQTLDAAKGWPQRAEQQSGIILKTYADLGIT
jgi:hypothetical protein